MEKLDFFGIFILGVGLGLARDFRGTCLGRGWRSAFASFALGLFTRFAGRKSQALRSLRKRAAPTLALRLSFDAAFGGIWGSLRGVWGEVAECGDTIHISRNCWEICIMSPYSAGCPVRFVMTRWWHFGMGEAWLLERSVHIKISRNPFLGGYSKAALPRRIETCTVRA